MIGAAPLAGTTVIVTRPRDADPELPRLLRRAGARVVWQPVICVDERTPTRELDEALRDLERFEWIAFTSVRGVSAFWSRAQALGLDLETIRPRRIASVGPATARAITRNGLDVTIVALPYSARGLLERMTSRMAAGMTVLYPRAADAGPTLVEGLRRLGVAVTDVIAYGTVPARSLSGLSRALEAGADCIVFCSPSAVRAVLPYHTAIGRCAIACIGPATADAARAAGLPVQIVPCRATAFALADAVIKHFAGAAS